MDKNQQEKDLVARWHRKFLNAMVSKSDYTKRWQRYYDAYNGDYFKSSNNPDYKSDLVSNYIFSIIETIRPIMLDNDPKFQALARQPEGMQYSNDLHESLSYEWDREDMNAKLYRELITTLVTGTSIFFLPWDSESKNVKAIAVNPFNLFPDPLATSVEDAEYLIYATYKAEGELQKLNPDKAEEIRGSQINYSELVRDNDKSGVQINDQILVLEIYAKDWSRENIDVEGGIKKSTLKYPHGRVLTICPEIGVLLSDKALPYKDNKFPFQLIKDYDVPGKFWGEGEVAQLLSPQKYMNELANSVIDNAKHTANVPWIIDKTSGIPKGTLSNRPGLVVRKNPGTEVRRDQPPSMPAYVQQSIADLKADMEQVSGVFDTLKGNSETGVYTAQGILALQEAGQARIRLKVKLLENALGKLACMWYSRMKQFWKDDKFIRITRFDGSYDLKAFRKEALKYDYDIRITAGSTMAVNRGAMLDLMIRLAQTMMEDGKPLVDREAVVHFLPEEVKASLLKRMANNRQSLEQIVQNVEQLGQQVQEQAKVTEQSDSQIVSTIEQLMSAVESINSQILQLKDDNAKMVEKQKQEERDSQIKNQAYNEGYADAEKSLKSNETDADVELDLPDEVINGLNELTDDQLALIVAENPELLDLLNKSYLE